ncbi:tRNA (adenosine(37)-N6)-threonylcarbamoyltransferase complex transferase subunit TsaD [bacterium CG10_46_32]|nr:MAG: tRNA (adenosine(37)-N6)-threonylcarbamoyltransferase complex transferase subunit TsaD [bacterium CG10_46_32]PIR55861.1 MAG: tRNA (adenosine(37)-N6)-threonylcarbamoyltransferase complex transferase subunit TsaD [Parcubacteria group bacterium CG10_big_fil_rev_8_21_14_0_10_46_32]
MMILGIETSCDDTGIALVEAKSGRFYVQKNVIISQAKLHNKYGGVVPELAARSHLKNIIPAIHEALGTMRPSAVDAIAVTAGPGLATSLHIGVETAKTLSVAWNVPLVGTNHMEGHIYSVLLDGKIDALKFPVVALVVSGGHTELILMPKHGEYKLIGKTRDDAAGEAFDKAAKMLGLDYPGGPTISKHAELGDPQSFYIPRPMMEGDSLEFSFSGMKNAIRLLVESLKKSKKPLPINDLAASIQSAIVEILAVKSLRAVELVKPKTFILSGGVAANTLLRETIANNLPKGVTVLISPLAYSQDNGAMIASAAYRRIIKKQFDSPESLSANAHWELV